MIDPSALSLQPKGPCIASCTGFSIADIEQVFGTNFTPGNKVTLLWKDRESFNIIFDAIRAAREHICLEFYIFRNDETGTELAELLKKKAKEGVRVYLLYDHFGSFTTPAAFWQDLVTAGVAVRASRPFKWMSPLHYVHRDHTKLIIVDGERAFTGGLNIANEYRGYHILRKKTGWRDTGIFLEGPVAITLLGRFRRVWEIWKGSFPEAPEGLGAFPDGVAVLPVFSHSARERRRLRKLLYYSINSSRKSIYLTTAYFTPSRRMVQVLEAAVSRGVDVRLLLPGISDIPSAHYAGRAFFTKLLRAGIRIYNYSGVILHAKTAVFDGEWSIIGSANLDFQSLRRNDEGNVGICGKAFGELMDGVFSQDLLKSEEISLAEWHRRPWTEKLKENFFALFRRRL
ncbi:MAG: cardiolipin synthase B [Nitrospirae bacterium]|nr:cardiolipin synthase B [Nitrospirota bacterium]